jgi:hypothetical protein
LYKFDNSVNTSKKLNKSIYGGINMNKIITGLICAIVILGAIITGIVISNQNEEKEEIKAETNVADENILDECTDEYEEMQEAEMLETDAQEEKISPNCSFTIRTYYKGCGHITSQYNNIPEDLVNKTEKELKEMYPEYMVETFKSNEVVVYIEKEGECGEHYLVKDLNGTVVIYERLSDGTKKLLEETGISTDYLPETDKVQMQNGIEVNGKQELNQLIEDYE